MHLRCRLTKNSPRRAKSTPAGVFCTLLASTPSICKKDYYKEQTVNLPRLFQKRIILKTFIAKNKPSNFFLENKIPHITRIKWKKIFRSIRFLYWHVLGLGLVNPKKQNTPRSLEPAGVFRGSAPKQTEKDGGAWGGRFCQRSFEANPFCRGVLPPQKQTRGLRGYLPLKNIFRRKLC